MTSKKQELKRNDLAEVLEQKLEQIKPYTNVILLGVLLVVVLVGGITWWVIRQRSQKEEMWGDFYAARNTAVFEANPRDLLTHAERYEDSRSAEWARQLAADLRLQEGARAIYSDREEGESLIREAIALYDQVIEQAGSDSLLRQSALYGRAQAYETVLDLEAARADYQAAGEAAEADSALAVAVERRLELLSDPELESYAAAFMAYDPQASTDPSDLMPSNFSPNVSLPPIPNISFPTSSFPPNQGNTDGLEIPGGANPEGGQTDPAAGGSDENKAGQAGDGDSKGASGDAGSGDAGSGDDQSGDKNGDSNSGDDGGSSEGR